MATFLIDRHSPIRSGIAPKLRHRSRHSESENHNGETSFVFNSQEDKVSPDQEDSTANSVDQDGDHERSFHATENQKVKSKSMLSYFMTELTRDYKLEGDASEFVERRDRVYTSVNTPKNLEKFCAFGFLQCLDSILYMVTFLPLRILVAFVRVLTYPCAVFFMGSRRVLDGAQICDLLKGVILVVSCFITSYMDMSMIYHIVRGQSIIKFYVFYNMLDVMDKLVSGFGQDVLDSLYWTAVEPRGRKREHFGTLFHLIFAIVYVVIHTVMILIQAIILNVAFNSHNKNLLTIMMSNNFVEIKGNLFKRLDKNNLCQITYSDVKERFHYLVLLLFVFIRNMKELQWSWDQAFPIIQDAAIVMLVEVVVDWIKHAFITKFNELSASSYADFALGLAQDIASSQKKHAFTNFSDQVCRRMGFTPMPLICLLFMVCTKSFNINGPLPWLLVFLFYLCLISTKVLNSIILLGWAQRLITERDKTTKSKGTVVNSQVIPKKEEKSAAPKANPEINIEPTIPLIITSRPVTVSSSVAVNTDPAPARDLLHQDHQVGIDEISTSVSSHDEICGSHVSRDYFIPQEDSMSDVVSEGIFTSSASNQSAFPHTNLVASSQGHSVKEPCPEASEFLHSDITTDQISHYQDTVSNLNNDNHTCANIENLDLQTILGNSSLSSSKQTTTVASCSITPSHFPQLQRSSSAPVQLPTSPKRKHPDSPTYAADSFFETLEESPALSNVSVPFESYNAFGDGGGKDTKEDEINAATFQCAMRHTVSCGDKSLDHQNGSLSSSLLEKPDVHSNNDKSFHSGEESISVSASDGLANLQEEVKPLRDNTNSDV